MEKCLAVPSTRITLFHLKNVNKKWKRLIEVSHQERKYEKTEPCSQVFEDGGPDAATLVGSKQLR
jgi:hypothetical protein